MADFMTEFLAARPVAIVGASTNRTKYGNIVLRNLRGRGWDVLAVHPTETMIEGHPAYPSLGACPRRPALAVFIVPPAVGLQLLDDAQAAGVQKIWLQPGAASPQILERAQALGLDVIHDECIMVEAAREGQ